MPANSMTVINYNRALLPNRDKFKNRLGGYGINGKTEYNFPKATTKQINEIGKRLREERKIRTLKVIIVTTISFLGLVFFIFNIESIMDSLLF